MTKFVLLALCLTVLFTRDVKGQKIYIGHDSLVFEGAYKSMPITGGEIRNYYYNNSDKIRMVATFNQGGPTGQVKVYWENGKKKYDMSCEGWSKEGSVIVYDQRGRIFAQLSYKQNMFNGEQLGYRYGRLGKVWLSRKSYYKEGGYAHGVSYLYNKNGTIFSQAEYLNGKANGVYITYRHGKKRTVMYASGGIILRQEFYRNGKLSSTVHWYNGDYDKVRWVSYNKQGIPTKEQTELIWPKPNYGFRVLIR